MKYITLLLAALCGLLTADSIIFQEDFENGNASRFFGLQIIDKDTATGKFSAHEPNFNDKGKRTSYAYTNDLYPIKGDTWYRVSFKHRNDIKIGEVTVAVQESRNPDKMEAEYYAWQRKALPLNIDSWQSYANEFKTMPGTKAFRLHLAFDNEGTGGCAWWDDIKIEEIDKQEPPLSLEPFRAAATYTDIPTRLGYRVTNGNPLKTDDLVFHTKYYWLTLDLPAEFITLNYHQLPKGSRVRASINRAGNTTIIRELPLEGSGKATFAPHVEKLPAGKHLFTAELIQDGKTVAAVTKELWRLNKADLPTPQLEPIRTTTVGPKRQVLVNGKVFHPVAFSMVPGMGSLERHQQNASPSLVEYLDTFREQYAQTFFSDSPWKGPKWDKLPSREFAKYAVNVYRAGLDFAQAHNFYSTITFTLGSHTGKRFLPAPEDITYIVNELKDHPALYSWSLDEPEVGGNPPEQMIELYNTIKAADPNHIVHINLCDPKKYHLYAPSSDIGSQDVYPFPMMSLEETDYRMNKLVKAFPTAPLKDYLQGFNFFGLDMPTFDQVRASLLMDVMFDCHSLAVFAWGFYAHCLQTDHELQSYMRPIIKMFRDIQNVRDHGTPVTVPVETPAKSLRFKAFSFNGRTILMMVNISKDTPLTATFSVNGTHAADYFDNAWQSTFTNGKLTITLPPNGTQVLVID